MCTACSTQDWFGITFPDSLHPSGAFAKWYNGGKDEREHASKAVMVREVDVRWPHSKSCWIGDHGFC